MVTVEGGEERDVEWAVRIVIGRPDDFLDQIRAYSIQLNPVKNVLMRIHVVYSKNDIKQLRETCRRINEIDMMPADDVTNSYLES